MAPGHLPSLPSRCVACLVLTAAATLGAVTVDEAAAGPRTAASAEPSVIVPGPSDSTSGPPSDSPTGPPSGVTPSATPAGPSAAPAPPATLPSAPSGSPSDAAGSPSPGAGSPQPRGEQSPLAGLLAGEGRQRPGRQLTPEELARADEDAGSDEDEEEPAATDPAAVPAATPDTSPSPETGRPARQALDGPAVRQVQEMSLGVGISLVGLGLGFLALRMRRTD
ncbi:hypothetical protein AB0I52_02870 [Streptomyces sp. NPDC050423]|uniref:hypothetical protein n=1 Tax=Streptomyces sp. NPDC050423 TaxID=3155402 RepID=UPI00341697CB